MGYEVEKGRFGLQPPARARRDVAPRRGMLRASARGRAGATGDLCEPYGDRNHNLFADAPVWMRRLESSGTPQAIA